MKIKYITWVIAIAVIFFVVTKPIAADDPTEEDKTISIAESLLNSTVIVKTATHEGTGFYISPNEIITDFHVIRDEKATIENSKGEVCDTSLISEDHELDLAMLRTTCGGNPLKLATNAKVGQSVLMMGNPDGERFFLSKGIVSSLNRKDFISYDARTIEGNSGSPIVNLNGEVVGVARWVFKVSEKVAVATNYESLARFIARVRYELAKGE